MSTVNIAIVQVGDSKLEVNIGAIQRGESDFAIEEEDSARIGYGVADAIHRLDLDQAIVIWLEEPE